jgi:hypothetical protein
MSPVCHLNATGLSSEGGAVGPNLSATPICLLGCHVPWPPKDVPQSGHYILRDSVVYLGIDAIQWPRTESA